MYPMNIWNGLYMPVVLNQEAGAHWGGLIKQGRRRMT